VCSSDLISSTAVRTAVTSVQLSTLLKGCSLYIWTIVTTKTYL